MDFLKDKVSVNGFSMEYLKFGHGSNILVIIPGLSVQSSILYPLFIAKQYKLFWDDFTVYIFDRRMEVPPVYFVSDMAYDTVQAIKYLGLEDISIFGASQGGMIAMEIALQYPELVKKLVLCSTAMRVDEKRFSVINEWIKYAENNDKKSLFLSFGEKIYPKDTFEKFREALCGIAETVSDEELKRFIIIANGAKDLDITDKVSSIKCPVMLVSDNDDKVFGTEPTMEMAESFKLNDGFEMKIYSGFGHAVYDTSPDFREKMYCFLIK